MAKGLRRFVSSPETFYKPTKEQLDGHAGVKNLMGSLATIEAGRVNTGSVIPMARPDKPVALERNAVTPVDQNTEESAEASPAAPSVLAEEESVETEVVTPDSSVGSERSASSTKERMVTFPKTFEEARMLPGNTVEDFLSTVDEKRFEPLTSWEGSWFEQEAPLTERDRSFLGNEANLHEYRDRLHGLIKSQVESNPHEERRSAHSPHLNPAYTWQQLSSRAFIESRIEDSTTDPVTSRIYLNPHFDSMMDVFEKIIEKADAAGLRYKTKVFDIPIPKSEFSKMAEYYRKGKDTERKDPMLFYGFADSEDALLNIVQEVYEENPNAFVDRETPPLPVKIADGVSVGSEPKGFSGKESLTSHREKVLNQLRELCTKQEGWSDLSLGERRSAYARVFRKNVGAHNIHPDNIAFDSK